MVLQGLENHRQNGLSLLQDFQVVEAERPYAMAFEIPCTNLVSLSDVKF